MRFPQTTTGPLPAEQASERSSLARARIGIPAALALLGAIFFSPRIGAGFDYAMRLRYAQNHIFAYAEEKVPGYALGAGRILLTIDNGRVAVVSGSK